MKTHKRCTRCGRVRPLYEFHADRRAADGHRSKCRDCHLRRDREHRQHKLATDVSRFLMREFGLERVE